MNPYYRVDKEYNQKLEEQDAWAELADNLFLHTKWANESLDNFRFTTKQKLERYQSYLAAAIEITNNELEKMVESRQLEAKEKELRACKTCIHRLNNHDEEPCLSCHEESEWTQDPERLTNPDRTKYPRTDERAKPESVQSGGGESTDGGNISEDDWRQDR